MVDNPKVKLQFNESLVNMSMYPPYAICEREILSARVNRTLLLGIPYGAKAAYDVDLV